MGGYCWNGLEMMCEMAIELIWLSIGSTGGILWTQQCIFGLHKSGEYLDQLDNHHLLQKIFRWSWALTHVAHFDTGGCTYTRCVKRMIRDLWAVCSHLRGRGRASPHLTTCWRPVPPQALTHWELSLHSSVYLAARRSQSLIAVDLRVFRSLAAEDGELGYLAGISHRSPYIPRYKPETG